MSKVSIIMKISRIVNLIKYNNRKVYLIRNLIKIMSYLEDNLQRKVQWRDNKIKLTKDNK